MMFKVLAETDLLVAGVIIIGAASSTTAPTSVVTATAAASLGSVLVRHHFLSLTIEKLDYRCNADS